MSSPLTKDGILYLQRMCAVCGLYDGPLDGKWQSAIEQAETRFAQKAAALRAELGAFDSRTETNIATLELTAQRLARGFMKVAADFPHSVKIISGTRTYAEQNALYAIGRTAQMNRSPVTKAKGGQSNHNFGIAWDVGIFEAGGRYMTGATSKDVKAYRDLATLAKGRLQHLEWGGDWSSFTDPPHYQHVTGKSVAQVRQLFEAGKPFIA